MSTMDEQIQKDIEFCREHRNLYRDIYFNADNKVNNAYRATIVLPLCSSISALLVSIGLFRTIPKRVLTCIMITSGLSATLSVLYLKPDKADKRITHREAFFAYGTLKAELELIHIRRPLDGEFITRQNYQKCYKRKQQLITRYPTSLLE